MQMIFCKHDNKCTPFKFKRFLHYHSKTSHGSPILHKLLHFGKSRYNAKGIDSEIIQYLVLIPPLPLPSSVTWGKLLNLLSSTTKQGALHAGNASFPLVLHGRCWEYKITWILSSSGSHSSWGIQHSKAFTCIPVWYISIVLIFFFFFFALWGLRYRSFYRELKGWS